MAQPTFNKFIIVSMLAVLLAGFWLRASDLETYPPGVSNDEAKNLIDSAYIAQTGRTPLYEDEGRPEPINRLVAAVGSILYGNSLWAFRLTSAFWGLLSLAACYWATTQSFYTTSHQTRKLAGLMAIIFLATALGHITVTRSLYRAVPLTFFVLMFVGFTARGLRTYRWWDFIWSGVFIALGIYTYTSGFIVPVAFAPLGLILIIFHHRTWKIWLPRLILTGFVVALLTSPIIYLLLTQPSAVLARASDVAESNTTSLSRKIDLMIGQFFTRGDENPQYNVADAPLLASIFIPFFFVGLTALLVRLRQPISILIGGLFFLNMVPVILTDEITHGLRIYSEFAILPLIIGASVVLFLTLTGKILPTKTVNYLALAFILGIGIYQVIQSRSTYTNYWDTANTEWRKWRIYNRELSHNEWFFRSDRLQLTNWIKAQETPLLIPVDELTRDAQRGMLMSHYPYVDNADATITLPDNLQVVIPWSLESGDFMDSTLHFALLQDATITLLPPFTTSSHQSLITDLSSATEINNPDSNIPIVARVFTPSPDWQATYQQPTIEREPLALFNNELEIIKWYGDPDISDAGTQTYTIGWSVNRPVSHEYGMFIQILTQDWERITGVNDRLIYKWLYPTIAWKPEQTIPEELTIDIPENLPVGAYRLAAGAWYVNGGRMPAQSFIDETVDNIATIGWLKVPQTSYPQPSPDAIEVNTTFNNQFELTHAELNQVDDESVIINLYWQSLEHRPSIDATVFVHVLNTDNNIISQSDIRPWNGQYPTFIWGENEIIKTEHQLTINTTDEIRLVAGMYTQPDFIRLSAEKNNMPLPDNLIDLSALLEN